MNEIYSLIYPPDYRYNDKDLVRSESNDLIKRLGADWMFYHKFLLPPLYHFSFYMHYFKVDIKYPALFICLRRKVPIHIAATILNTSPAKNGMTPIISADTKFTFI